MRIGGRHSIIAAINNPLRKKKTLHCTSGEWEKIKPQLQEKVERRKIENFPPFLETNEVFIESSFNEILHSSRVLLIDSLTDPRNIGSIIRSAAILNFSIFIRERKGCPINETVVKCAAGGIEYIKIGYIKNISENLKKMQKEGFVIISLDENGKKKKEIGDYEKILLIIGEEGEGIGTNILNKSDFLCRLDGSQSFSTYNASVAAAIAMYQFKL